MDEGQYESARRVGAALEARGLKVVTAESCTGGLVAAAITMVPGSSGWFERGFITYTYASKREVLGVSLQTLETHGAVSEQTVVEMVAGALAASRADVAVAVSGTAGPGGGTALKPVGTVCIGWGLRNAPALAETHHFPGDREQVRNLSVVRALSGLLTMIEDAGAGHLSRPMPY